MKSIGNLRRTKFIYRFSVVGGLALGFFGLVHLAVGSHFKGVFELTMASIVFINVLWFRWRHSEQLAIGVAMVVLFAVMPFLIITGGLDNTGVIWIFLFPSVAFFLSGQRRGIYNTVVLFILIIGLLVAQATGRITTPYTLSFLRQALVALLVLSLILYFYESINEEDQGVIAERNHDLEQANQRLADEAQARAKAAEKLARQTADLEKLNQLMIGRELKMIELKQRLAKLEEKQS